MKNETSQKHFVRLLKWIGNNQSMWHKIIDFHHEEEISKEDFVRIKDELIKESFYEILLVFITIYQSERYIDGYLHGAVINLLADEFDNDNGKRFLDLFEREISKSSISN